MVARTLLTSVALLLCGLLLAQTNVQEKPAVGEDAGYRNVAPAREGYQGAWSASDLQRTVELWKQICAERPADVNAQFNLFRSERNARMEANNGRLKDADERELNTIKERIATAAPNSFEQHLANYYLQFPSPAADAELAQAEALGPDRNELILPALDRANTVGDLAALDRWCGELETRGGLAPALSAVAKDLLGSVARDGIVFANGDMDVAPALVQQRRHALRRDVLVVDQRLLADANYRQRIWIAAKATGPVPGSGPAFAAALHKATTRPVYLALSLDRNWFDAFPGQLCTTGIAFGLCNTGAADIASLQATWNAMERTTAAGPLSRNYLLPGTVLLEHYRTAGDEAQAALMEDQLRKLARAIGAEQDLLKAGILKH